MAASGTYAEVGRTTRQEEESAQQSPNYSRLGPAHETVDPGRQPGSQNQISSNVIERYELAEIPNMETDRQDFEHEDYSRLRH